jgi:hypothetical protein
MRDSGDSRLIAEVEQNHAAAAANGGVPRMDQLFGAQNPGTSTLQEQTQCIQAESRKHALDVTRMEMQERRLALVKSTVETFSMASDFLKSIGQFDSRQDIDIGLAVSIQIRNAATHPSIGQSPNDQLALQQPSNGVPMHDVTTSKIEAELLKDELSWSTRFITDHEKAIGCAVSAAYKSKYGRKPEKHPQFDKSNETRQVCHYTTRDRQLFQSALRMWYVEHTKGVENETLTCQACGVSRSNKKQRASLLK